MTNEEKYKTAEARNAAFNKFCKSHSCSSCKFAREHGTGIGCVFIWLAANAEPSIADIVAEMRTGSKYTREEWKALCDSLDAAAKRAYERIDNEMSTSPILTADTLADDCERIRLIMDETIGGYHTKEVRNERCEA